MELELEFDPEALELLPDEAGLTGCAPGTVCTPEVTCVATCVSQITDVCVGTKW